MPSYFCLTIRFLQPLSHGRGDDGEPEWPPSPLRLFQALVAASAARWNERRELRHAVSALRWVERQQAPEIVAATGKPSQVKYRLYVPDNIGDKVAGSWVRGSAADIAKKRTEKDVHSMHLDGEAVHYLYAVDDADQEFAKQRDTLFAAAQSITHLGWGIDMVAANATVISENDATKLSGERWRPVEGASGNGRRVPDEGTLQALMEKHKAFLSRLTPDGFKPVPPLTVFRVVGYRRAIDIVKRSFAAFSIRKVDDSGFFAFNAARQSRTVAGMMRYVARSAAKDAGWPEEKIGAFVLGHGEAKNDPSHKPVGPRRFAFLPLPSIESRGPGKPTVVGSIRRVLVTTFAGECETEVSWARRALSNQVLINEVTHKEIALLSLLPDSDKMVQHYAGRSSCWATVTPAVLPGYDDPDHLRRRAKNGKLSSEQQRRILDRLSDRVDGLLRKAIRQAGFSDELAQHAALDWRTTGFWPGTDLASRYGVPNYLSRFPKLHVRIEWRDAFGKPIEIFGPICIGGGRYSGLGLFAAIPG